MRAACLTAIALMLVFTVPGTRAAEPDSERAAIEIRAGETRTLLSDLEPEVRATLAALEDPKVTDRTPAEQLQAVFEATTPYEFDSGPLIVYSDPRWFSTYTPGADKSAILELRRWPGDSRLLLYAVNGPSRFVRGEAPPLADAEFEVRDGASATYAEWRGQIHTELGSVPAIWVEAPAVEGAETLLGALLLPGDAGLGELAVEDLTTELYTLLGRITIRPQLWGRQPGLPHGATIPLGTTVAVPGRKSEEFDPWQIAMATDFTVGVPPGVHARRTDAGVPAQLTFPGSKLWLRGRFIDMEGAAVVIGDANRAGYVAEVAPDAEGWIEGKSPPLGAANATSIASATFSLVKEPFIALKKRSGATGVRAGRWKEPGFAGEWLIFRIALPDRGIEIGLPMLAGRRSASLFWIPATWRDIGQPPAPPPVDPAARFGIKWETLTRGERAKRPWVEGILSVPGLKLELPLGWWPAATLRSTAGYPVRLVGPEGRTLARLIRLTPAELTAATLEGSGWGKVARAGVHRASAVWAHKDGRRLYVDRTGAAYEVARVQEDSVDATTWERLVDSVQLVRSGH